MREAPSEAELVSHKLMVRAGMIRRLASGLYTWMPLGLRVLRKVEAIVREEMDRSGALEMLMPAVQPAELWQESGRWSFYGPELLRLKDRHERDFCVGPTHEEVVTDVMRREIRSYRQLPLNVYQIQTKFRDEIRPRFGVMRAREFLMKDAYSFHANRASLQETYDLMYLTYSRIFARAGLRFRAVAADTGSIGGSGSHEFHVLADSGEDAIALCPGSDFAANVELAEALSVTHRSAASGAAMSKVATPGRSTCDAVAQLLGLQLNQTVKMLAVMHNEEMVLCLLRGDHTLNEVKAQKISFLSAFRFATDAEVHNRLGCAPGYIGPVGIDPSIPVVADRSVADMVDFCCGANEVGFHLTNVNFGRDLPVPAHVFDIRNVVAGDPSPDGKGPLEIRRGIEVGHIFQLGNKYSNAMQATYRDEDGKAQVLEMGCYGIGVTRVVAAAIEQNFDERGIRFPMAIAPFEVMIIPIGMMRNAGVREVAERLHQELRTLGVDAALDDRDERPGVMFADAELIGVPYRITIGERGLQQGVLEYQARNADKPNTLPVAGAAAAIQAMIQNTSGSKPS